MATFDYARSAATADRLIKRFGRTAQLGRSTPGTGPAHNPGAETWSSNDVTIATLPASKGTIEAFDNRLEGGTLIDEKLRFFYMSPKAADGSTLPFVPKSLDRLFFDNAYWMILGCTPLNPGGVNVLYSGGCKLIGDPEDATPPEPDRTWQTVFTWGARVGGSSSAANFATVQARISLDASLFPATTTKLRLTFAGAVDGADQTAHGFAAAVGKKAASGNPWDFVSAPTRALFSGVNTATLPSALPATADYPLVVSDEIDLVLDGTSSIVVAMTFNDGQVGAQDATGVEAPNTAHLYIDAASNGIEALSPSGLIDARSTFGNNYQWALYKVEAYA